MTGIQPWTVAREHPIAGGVVVGVIAVQITWMAGAAMAVCPRMTMTECVVVAVVLVAAASVAGIAVRVGWLAATTTWALAKLPRVPTPQPLDAARHRAGIARIRCLGGTDRTAFCAAVPAMGGATQTRIAHLLGEDLPIRRPPLTLVVLSLLGAIGAVWLVMCLGQGALAAMGIWT